MSKKFTFSKSLGNEVFTAVEFDSFDEAIKAVEKGIYERQLVLVGKPSVLNTPTHRQSTSGGVDLTPGPTVAGLDNSKVKVQP